MENGTACANHKIKLNLYMSRFGYKRKGYNSKRGVIE